MFQLNNLINKNIINKENDYNNNNNYLLETDDWLGDR
jgi:hypothetical protein